MSDSTTPVSPAQSNGSAPRLLGIDFARAVAICGMAWIHFAEASTESAPGWLQTVVSQTAGRPATMFMILAGMGISLRLASKPSISSALLTIRRRGWFFLIFGFVHLLWWSGDILRVYGVSFLIASWMLPLRGRRAWWIAAFFFVGFLVLFVALDYETHWDWETLEYDRMWSLDGAAMNLFYNGFRTVFPWTGLLFVGIWLGTQDLRSPDVRRRLLRWSLGACVVAEGMSQMLLYLARSAEWADDETLVALLGTTSMPPLPLFMVASAGFAVFVIIGIVGWIDGAAQQPRGTSAMIAAGQMAFTWYIVHVFFVYVWGGISEELWDTNLLASVVATAVFCLGMCLVSRWYRRHRRLGPLEWLLRRVAG